MSDWNGGYKKKPNKIWDASSGKASFFAGAGSLAVIWCFIRGSVDADSGLLNLAFVPLFLLFVIGLACIGLAFFFGRDEDLQALRAAHRRATRQEKQEMKDLLNR